MNFAITVLVTTYNCGVYIKQAIQSILNQTYKYFELLIIDDGSNDNTDEIVWSFNDDRIRYIKTHHIGRSAALNMGLQDAKHELISFCDADDIIHPQKLEKQLRLFKNENDLVFTDTAVFRNKKILYELKILNVMNIIKRKIALHGHFGQSILYNRDFILRSGGYNNNLTAFIDYDLLLRIFNKGNIIVLPEVLYFQRLRENSISTTDTMKKKHIIYQVQKNYFTKLEENFGISSNKDQLIIKGWREFFYGGKKTAREYWLKAGFKVWDLKLTLTFLLSFLPESFLDYIKNKRVRLMTEYRINKLFGKNNIQIIFNRVVEQLAAK